VLLSVCLCQKEVRKGSRNPAFLLERHSQMSRVLAPTFLALAGLITSGCAEHQKSAHIPTDASSGVVLYRRYCAVCHANDGKGNGPPPSTSSFSQSPPDLTTLSRRNGGEFPEDYVLGILQSGIKLPDHGSAEMPVWGEIFKVGNGLDARQVKTEIENLTGYIRSLQQQ
jgi:mono/diheme cytochrome c family protein